MRYYCTACDHASESTVIRKAWRCPRCDGKHRSRNPKVEADRYFDSCIGLARREAITAFNWYGAARVAKRVGTFDDLEAIAFVGLIDAARGFDPSRGFAFTTYATLAVRRHMTQAIQGRTTLDPHGEVSRDAMADLDAHPCFADPRAVDPVEVAAKNEEVELLHAKLGKLPAKEQAVIRARFFADKTLREIGAKTGVTRERVRQLESKGIERLQAILARYGDLM